MAAIRVVTRIEDEDDFTGNLANDGYFLQWSAAQKTFVLTPSLAITSQTASFVLIAPTNGGLPTFRALVEADLPAGAALRDQNNAFTGLCSFNQVPVLPNQNATTFLAGPPSGGAATPVFRFIQPLDLPIFAGDTGSGGTEGAVPPPPSGSAAANEFLGAGGSWTTLPVMVGDSGTGGKAGVVPAPPSGSAAAGDFLRADGVWAMPTGGSGTINLTFTAPNSIFQVVGSPFTNSGTLSLNLVQQIAHTFFAGPPSGFTGIPTFRTLALTDMPNAVVVQTRTNFFIGAQNFDTVPTLPNQSANQVLAGPSSGPAAAPGFRSLATSDLGTGTASTSTFLRGDLSWAAPPGSGTVTSVGLSLPAIFTVSGSPVTGSGTLSASLANESANLVFAGPTTGSAAAPTFRSLVAADIPVMVGDSGSGGTAGAVPAPPSGSAAANKFLKADGTWQVPAGTGSGTVNSVALALPNIFTVSGSPVTTSGTLTGALANQNPNLIFAGPSSGAAAAPTFRALGEADLPTTTAFTDQPNTFAPAQTFSQLPVLPSTPQNEVLASPIGAAGPPTMRALDVTDIPVITRAQQDPDTAYQSRVNTFTQTQNFNNFINIQLGQKILWNGDLGTSILGANSPGDPTIIGSTSNSAAVNGQLLQQALDTATPGTVLLLTAGAQFLGPFVCNNIAGTSTSSPITLQSSALSSLPAAGGRVNPAMSSLMPQLQFKANFSNGNSDFSGGGCINFDSGSNNYNLIGLEIKEVNSQAYLFWGLVNIGTNDTASHTINTQNGSKTIWNGGQTALSQQPTNINIDRCYLHGPDTIDIGQTSGVGNYFILHGIELHGSNCNITGCWIQDILTHGNTNESHGIWCCNGSGNYQIINNYIEAGTENIFVGGVPPAITSLAGPKTALVKFNHLKKQGKWSISYASFFGATYDQSYWWVKNLFELKAGDGWTLDTNVLENCWASTQFDQPGWAILLTARGGSSGQGNSNTYVGNVTIKNNLVLNACGFIDILQSDDNGSNGGTLKGTNVITGNLCENMQGTTTGGTGNMFYLLCGAQNSSGTLDIDHNTCVSASTGFFYAAIYTHAQSGVYAQVTFKNNLVVHGANGQIHSQGANNYTPDQYGMNVSNMATTLPNMVCSHNVFYKGSSSDTDQTMGTITNGSYASVVNDSTNANPLYSSVGFANLSLGYLAGKDYRLTTSSPYKGTADSTYNGAQDPGANVIDTAIYNVVEGTQTVPTATIGVNPTSISSGATATLTWTTTNATSATLSGGQFGTGTAVTPNSTSSQSVSPTTSTTYTIVATDANNNQATKSVTLSVSTVLPTATLTASSTSITAGQSVNIAWTSTNGVSWTLQQGSNPAQQVTANGNQNFTLNSSTTFTFVVTDSQGRQASQSVTVSVGAVPAATLTVDKSSIDIGQSSTLTWTSSNATSFTLNGSPVAANGSQTVTPAAVGLSTYTFVATNAQNVSAQASVTITVGALPTASISASPTNISPGQAVTITWSSTNGVSATLNGSPVALSGSQVFNPTTSTTYTLVVTDNQGGQGSASVSVQAGTVLTYNATGQHVFDGAPVKILKNVGFFGANPTSKPTVTGAKGSAAFDTSLMAALVALGLVTDNST